LGAGASAPAFINNVAIIQRTFERWLQQFDRNLHIESVISSVVDDSGTEVGKRENPDVDVLYLGDKRLCSVPKGLSTAKGWSRISDKRTDERYVTSDGIAHRSLSGIGLVLLQHRVITSGEFVKYFISSRNKRFLQKLQVMGIVPI
jgi:hypothetical protein